MQAESGRETIKDKKFNKDLRDKNIENKLFLRLVSKGVTFENVDFKYGIFKRSYLRSCNFISCDFTGCQFIDTNLYKSDFENCNFRYATFENTIVDKDILHTECPPYENLKLKFARSLRKNYEEIGDPDGVNEAIQVELDASEEHLRKSWSSRESYYRNKYSGIDRFLMFLKWSKFKSLDFIWGNGESMFKLGRTFLFLISLIWVYDSLLIQGELASFYDSIELFFGINKGDTISDKFISLVTVLRLLLMGAFISILIKKYDRR